jgi:isopenicillin-N epimerase
MNRRDLFQLATQVATAAGAAQLFSVPASGGIPTDEDFWAEIRNEFTTDRTVVNLNNGYASPAPRSVQDAMRRYLDYSNMGPYHTMIRELEPKVEAARRMIAEAAGCDAEEIAITRNSSESLEIAQLGLDLKPGDEVVTTNQDYPRMITTYQQRERRDGIVLKQISFPVPVTSMDDLYGRFEKAITPKTKVIHFCHITNRTGQIFPVRRLCDLAAARGIVSIVDGAHAFSQFPYKISDLNCDYYGVSLHKWTFAPIGTGFLYVRKSRIKDSWPLRRRVRDRARIFGSSKRLAHIRPRIMTRFVRRLPLIGPLGLSVRPLGSDTYATGGRRLWRRTRRFRSCITRRRRCRAASE